MLENADTCRLNPWCALPGCVFQTDIVYGSLRRGINCDKLKAAQLDQDRL